jgi:hypothetical protein
MSKVNQVAPARGPAAADLSNVTVTVKPPEHVNIDVDIDRLKWRHSAMLQQAMSPDLPEEEQEALIFGVLEAVTGQDMRDQPLRVINAVLAEIKGAFGDDSKN